MESGILSDINSTLKFVAKIIELCGVLTIIIGGIVATKTYIKSYLNRYANAYDAYRGSLGRAILLGLELLVAGDIIGTVAIEPTYESLGVLGLIVLIRTFLSFSLEVEITGHWPWSHKKP